MPTTKTKKRAAVALLSAVQIILRPVGAREAPDFSPAPPRASSYGRRTASSRAANGATGAAVRPPPPPPPSAAGVSRGVVAGVGASGDRLPFVLLRGGGGGACPVAHGGAAAAAASGRLPGGAESGGGEDEAEVPSAWKAVGGLALSAGLYYAAHDRLVVASSSSDAAAPLRWMLGWAAAGVASSFAWLARFGGGYTEAQRERVRRTHWQDKILAALMAALGGALHRAGQLGPGTVGGPVTLLLPFANMWFTLESKFLTHLWVGTPFHPTWWCDGAVKRFAPSTLINLTFAIATGLQTILLTSYAAYAVLEAVGGYDILRSPLAWTAPLWAVLASHGMTQVWASGMWMIAASSGVPAWVESMTFMDIPPLLPLDPSKCVELHKRDLLIGVALLAASVFVPKEADNALVVASKAAVALSWLAFIGPKAKAHLAKKTD